MATAIKDRELHNELRGLLEKHHGICTPPGLTTEEAFQSHLLTALRTRESVLANAAATVVGDDDDDDHGERDTLDTDGLTDDERQTLAAGQFSTVGDGAPLTAKQVVDAQERFHRAPYSSPNPYR
jgi:hypothetical protein